MSWPSTGRSITPATILSWTDAITVKEYRDAVQPGSRGRSDARTGNLLIPIFAATYV